MLYTKFQLNWWPCRPETNFFSLRNLHDAVWCLINVPHSLSKRLQVLPTLTTCSLQLTISWSSWFWMGPSALALGPSLQLDWCATLAMWRTLSFATCSWCTAETADFRYQVWHQNQATAIDRQSLVVVSEVKSPNFGVLQVCLAKKMFCSGLGGATTPIELKFGIQPSTTLYFHQKKFQPWTRTFYFFQFMTHGP